MQLTTILAMTIPMQINYFLTAQSFDSDGLNKALITRVINCKWLYLMSFHLFVCTSYTHRLEGPHIQAQSL